MPSSGLHTNGFSLVRSIFDTDSSIKTYLKKFLMKKEIWKVLAEPHREYLSDILHLLMILTISHITGGAFIKIFLEFFLIITS